MNKTRLLSLAAAAVLASSVVLAAEGEPPKFAVADKNGDGAVDAAEHKAAGLKFKFADADTDGNGTLNKEEYEAAVEGECV